VIRKAEFPGNLAAVTDFSVWIKDGLAAAGVDSTRATLWEIGLVEAFTNIARHGYARSAGPVRCTLAADDATVHIDLEDDAAPFDPTAAVPRERSGNEPHGMGLAIMRDAAAEIRYERNGACNRLKLAFRR
jgi:anti-sigma regulatory factor (Ser/Thr protein kinase)